MIMVVCSTHSQLMGELPSLNTPAGHIATKGLIELRCQPNCPKYEEEQER